jgi:voltage-gated potassium channel
MLLLSFAWLVLVIVELAWGTTEVLETFGLAIWGIFILEFLLRFALAPEKLPFLRQNWLTVIALIVPAFRLFRVLRAVSILRGLRLVRIVGTANRGMNALRTSMRRHGAGYVLWLTVIVVLLGAGGMLTFEPASDVEGGLTGYADALWWTVMLITSLGSNFWPTTVEGRLLCVLLAIYGLAVFGYITATFASFFLGRDAQAADGELASAQEMKAMEEQIGALRAEIAALRMGLEQGDR